MNDPTNFYAIDDVRMVSGCDISIVLSEQQDIINAINNFYGVSGRVGGSLNKLKEDSFAPVIRRVEDSSEDAPIIKSSTPSLSRLSEIRPVISISNPRRMIRGCVFVLTAFYVMR